MPSSDAHERRSLLHEGVIAKRVAAATALPRAQLATIFAIKLAVILTAQQASPYINELLARTVGCPSNEIGYYAGLLSVASNLCQISSTYPWGRISDRIGRRLPLFLCLSLLVTALVLFGVATKLSALIFARMLIGIGTGAVGVMHSVVGELTDESNASTAFPLYDTVAAVGFVIAPLLGGLLVHPGVNFPNVFTSPFWASYPYLLPCMVVASYTLFASILTLSGLKETNPRITRPTGYQAASDVERSAEPQSAPPGARELLRVYPMLRYISASSGAIGFTAAAFNVFFGLLAYSNLADGGLQLSPAKIGIALSTMGLISIPLKLSLPFVLTRWSTLTVFRVSLRAWPVTFTALPLLSVLARSFGPDRSAGQDVLMWAAISTVLFLSRVGCMAFGLVMLLVKEHSPEPASLGAANGITELAQMIGILVGPPVITSLFAFSVTHNVLGGYFWALVIVALSLALARVGDVMIRHEASMPRTVRERAD